MVDRKKYKIQTFRELKRGIKYPFIELSRPEWPQIENILNLNCPYLQQTAKMIIQVSIFRNINFPMYLSALAGRNAFKSSEVLAAVVHHNEAVRVSSQK